MTDKISAANERRETLIKEARDIVEKAQAENRDLTADEQKTVDDNLAEHKSLCDQLAAHKKSEQTMAALNAMAPPVEDRHPDTDTAAKSLGEHFVKHGLARLIESKGSKGFSVSVPEFAVKDSPATHTTVGWTDGVPYLTDYDRTVVRSFRPRLTVADLLGQGTVSGNAISYLVEGATVGAFTTVAQGTQKPQIEYENPTAVVDALKKIAGYIELTDEFIEDADFLVSEINNRLLYQLGWFEEQQLLDGGGTGADIKGILRRDYVQTETSDSSDDNPDAVFRSMTKVETASGLPADGIVIHPTDYQAFRLAKDDNLQYYGGGFFQGQYGTGGVPMQPPLWGLRTVVTPAISQGTVLVGAFSMAATLYRKGGVRVESTNSHASNFTTNIVTIRAEERVALAVRVPLGFCKLTLAGGS